MRTERVGTLNEGQQLRIFIPKCPGDGCLPAGTCDPLHTLHLAAGSGHGSFPAAGVFQAGPSSGSAGSAQEQLEHPCPLSGMHSFDAF